MALGPTLVVEPNALNLGEVPAGSRARCRFKLINAGSGSLTGTVHSTAPWLHVEPQRFAGNRTDLRARLATKGLDPGRYKGIVEIDSNGGKTSVVVEVEITDPAGWFDRVGGLLPR